LWFDFLQERTFKGIFKGKQDQFEEKLDTTGAFLGKLVAYEVITQEQREDIEVNSITLLQVRFS